MMNYIDMCHVCEGCNKDCELAWADGSCALMDDAEPPTATIAEVDRCV